MQKEPNVITTTTLNPKTLKSRTLNPKTLNPRTLNPQNTNKRLSLPFCSRLRAGCAVRAVRRERTVQAAPNLAMLSVSGLGMNFPSTLLE